MKILFLGNSTSWHVAPWVNFFAKNHEVSLFSFIEPYAHSSSLKNVYLLHSYGFLGFFLKFFKVNTNFFYNFNRIISIPLASIKLSIFIKKNNIQIVHAHSVYYGFLAYFIIPKVKIVFTPMGSDVLVHPVNSIFYKIMTRIAYIKPAMITGDSYLIQKTGLKYGANMKKNFVIQNGVDQDIFYPSSKNPNLIDRYDISQEQFVLYSPRQVEELYNIDIIVESLNLIKQQGHNFKCMFTYGPDSQYIKSLKEKVSEYKLDDNVIWLGLLTHKEMAEHYNLSDLVISIPSSDSSPRSVYEAAFCNKFIIVSDLDWSYEFFDNPKSLLKIPIRNINSLTKAISDFMLDQSSFSKYVKNSNKIAQENFDFDKNMTQMEKLLYGLIDEH